MKWNSDLGFGSEFQVPLFSQKWQHLGEYIFFSNYVFIFTWNSEFGGSELSVMKQPHPRDTFSLEQFLKNKTF